MDKIINIVGKVLGGSNVADKLFDLFKGDKQKQRDFELELKQSLVQELQAEFKDLQNAREMQMEALRQGDIFSKRFVYYLAAGLLLATTVISILPFFVNVPMESQSLVSRATDFFFTVSGGSIIAFFFGAKK